MPMAAQPLPTRAHSRESREIRACRQPCSRVPLRVAMKAIGVFENHQDVGAAKLAGNAVYDANEQTYTLSSAGVNAPGTLDQFHFASKRIKGDFIVQATLRLAGKGSNPRRKLGIVARDASSRYA